MVIAITSTRSTLNEAPRSIAEGACACWALEGPRSVRRTAGLTRCRMRCNVIHVI